MSEIGRIGPYFHRSCVFKRNSIDFLFIPFRHQVQDSESEEDFQPYFDEVRASFKLEKLCDQ